MNVCAKGFLSFFKAFILLFSQIECTLLCLTACLSTKLGLRSTSGTRLDFSSQSFDLQDHPDLPLNIPSDCRIFDNLSCTRWSYCCAYVSSTILPPSTHLSPSPLSHQHLLRPHASVFRLQPIFSPLSPHLHALRAPLTPPPWSALNPSKQQPLVPSHRV